MTHHITAGMLLAVAEEPATTTPGEPTPLGVGAIVIGLAAVAVLAWLGYLWVASMRRRRILVEETPPNLQPFLSDHELENVRVTRVLSWAVAASAVLAVAMGVYFFNEPGRLAAAEEKFHEKDIEEGHKWYQNFSCINCHGPDAGGGGAPFVEKRSGLDVSWSAPSLNDIFFRYSEDEVRFWIVNGRPGTPMPANGLEGGGAMTIQEVDQVMEYLHSIQISQDEALGKIDGAVNRALNRIAGGAETVAALIASQEAEIADIEAAPDRFAVFDELPARARAVLSGAGTCTEESAALVGAPCDMPGQDSDRDGLTDDAEAALTEIARIAADTAPIRDPQSLELKPDEKFEVRFDPTNGFTMVGPTGRATPDLDTAAALLRELDAVHLTLSVIAERQDRFLEAAQQGLDFLLASAEAQKWIPEGVEVVSGENGPELDGTGLAAAMGVSEDEALRGLGLYNAYCARCHTAGYSAGVAFEEPPGSGAWAPALWDGRTIVQFPDMADHIDFIIKGSNQNENYGVNGIGKGWMPGFGQVLSAEDIELIVKFERSL